MVKPQKKFQIGKKGLTKEFVEQIRTYFEKSKSEIVKIEILKSCCRDKKKAKEIGRELVGKLGKNFDFKLIGYVLVVMRFRKSR